MLVLQPHLKKPLGPDESSPPGFCDADGGGK